MALADLNDDGDFKLVTADFRSKRLKVFMGTNVLHTTTLASTPTAVTVFYSASSKPMIPIIAVAVEHPVYYFKEY